jgi:lactose/L-arabinose transport system permease protein
MMRLLANLALGACGLLAAFPLAWLLAASLKAPPDQAAHLLLPWNGLERVTLDGWRSAFAGGLWGWLANSVILAALQTTLQVGLCAMAGFALAKRRFAARPLVIGFLAGTMMLPGQVLLPASYELMFHLGWLNTWWAVVLPGAVSAFGILLMRNAFLAVPDELLEAARIDGAGEWRAWWEVALPCVRPMLGALTLMSFVGAWNSFLWPQVVLGDAALQPLPVALAGMAADDYNADFAPLMAATALAIAPPLALFAALQRDFVAGLTQGAVKG